ncbi:MAG: hypothetical protein PHU65_06090 [Actinomycetota bacterium]|nr:hypothetical protein [Actinomycetota bacterium]
MKDINLLPKTEKLKKKGSFLYNLFLIILLILFLTISVLSYFYSNTRKELKRKLDIIEKTNFDLNIYKDKLLYYKNFEKDVNYKSALVKALDLKTIKWSKKLYDLSEILPEKTYILNFSGRCDNLYSSIESLKNDGAIPKGKVIAFNIEGYANNYVEISRLILGIKEITDISDPWIASIRESEIANIELLYFKVEAYWNMDEFLKDIKIDKPDEIKDMENEIDID